MMASKLQPEKIVAAQVADFSQVTTVFHIFSSHFSAISNWFLAGCGIIMVYLNRARRKKCDYKQNQPRMNGLNNEATKQPRTVEESELNRSQQRKQSEENQWVTP
jgi:hypothetical protein